MYFNKLRALARCNGLDLETTGNPVRPWRMFCTDGQSDFDNTYETLTDAAIDLENYVDEVIAPAERARFLATEVTPGRTLTETLNQCDGCRAAMPLVDGIHYHNGRIVQGCEADRY